MKLMSFLRVPEKDAKWIENAHVALWLLKDMSWCSHWHWIGMFVVLPTLLLAVKIAWDSRTVIADLVHNVAVCFWICANITWMGGEFFMNDGTRPHAKFFFYVGLALLVGYYLYSIGKRWNDAYRLRHVVPVGHGETVRGEDAPDGVQQRHATGDPDQPGHE